MIKGRSDRTFTTTQSELSAEQIEQRFGSLLAEARSAYANDFTYLVDMAERGSLINYKRLLWSVRMEASRAEAEARRKCQMGGSCPFTCTNQTACGFGHCRWAAPEHAAIKTAPPTESKNQKKRPVEARSPNYRLEDAIAALLEKRGIHPPARLSSGSRRRREE